MGYRYRYNQQRDENGLLLQDADVLKLLLQGKTRPQICRELGVPKGTVDTCCARVFRHLGVRTLPELIIKYGGEKR